MKKIKITSHRGRKRVMLDSAHIHTYKKATQLTWRKGVREYPGRQIRKENEDFELRRSRD